MHFICRPYVFYVLIFPVTMSIFSKKVPLQSLCSRKMRCPPTVHVQNSKCNWLKPIHDSNNKQVVDYAFTFANTTFVNSGVLNAFWFGISVNFSLKPETFSFQNNNLERALDWIFTHPEEEESDALSDMADTEPNDNAFSNANSHSDSTLSPDRDTSGPRVKDGPGRE